MIQLNNQQAIGKEVYSNTSGSREKISKKKKTNSSTRQGGKITVRRSISAASYMLKIAQATTSSQVSAVINAARADLQFAKTCNTDISEVAKAKKIIKRVIGKCQKKIKRLKEEQHMEQQQNLMEGVKKREILRKLQQKRRARKAEEAADVCDMEHATLTRSEEWKELSAEERAVMNGNDAAVSMSLDGVECAVEASLDMAAGGVDACGMAVDVVV